MKKIHWIFSFIILAVLFFQCQKDVSFIGGPDAGVTVAPDPINTSIQGNITDENDQPAVGVTVTAGTSTTITDANGYFHISKANLDKNTSLITAEKEGYFKGYRVLAATSGCNQVAIKLIRKDLAGTVSSAAGGEASLSNGAKVNLPANSVMIASSNSAYNGDVKVYASYINPTSSDIGKTIPGSLVANDKNGKRVVLSSYGMLAVELSSTSGEKLQIKNGSVATLTIPIASNSFASAPATISLWYIDEATGIWKEEGSATKQGSNYVGTVKHFSFWNTDYAFPSVSLSLILHTPDDKPLANATVRITAKVTDTSATSSSVYGYTDSLGQVKGLVPANTSLALEVLGTCTNSVVFSQEIAGLAQDKDLGIIKVTDNAFLLTLTGTLLNCSSAPVTNGYAIISLDGNRRNVATDANGRFTTTFVTCYPTNANIFISGVDVDAQQQSSQTEMTATLPLADVGNIIACGNSIENRYINYTLDGTDYSLTAINGDSLSAYQLNSSETRIYGYTLPSVSNFISFKSFTGVQAGTFSLHELEIRDGDSVYLSSHPTVTFSKFPSGADNWYEGHFDNVKFTDSVQATHTISATFRIKQN